MIITLSMFIHFLLSKRPFNLQLYLNISHPPPPPPIPLVFVLNNLDGHILQSSCPLLSPCFFFLLRNRTSFSFPLRLWNKISLLCTYKCQFSPLLLFWIHIENIFMGIFYVCCMFQGNVLLTCGSKIEEPVGKLLVIDYEYASFNFRWEKFP